MNPKKVFAMAVVFILFSFSFAAGQQSEMDPKMMEKWMEYATPNENHEALKFFEGS